jgi:hypothetical protein
VKWQPWYKATGTPPEATNNGEPITEPPCKHCKHWKPEIVFIRGNEGQVVNGVRLCHSESQHQDFSCFGQREQP